ncbi:MAG: tetratricopeptide repeat protein [Thermoplasmata archaeon]|nr:tetratricopeptide repeat protein [Thermoplasmata archaeon]
MPIFGGKKDKKSKAVAAIEELLDEADAHLKGGDLDKAASEYRRGHRYLYREEGIAENPEEYSSLFTRTGHGLFETGEPDRAVECFDKATQLNPKNTDAWMSRGIVHMKSGAMLNYAVMCFDEVLKYEENNLEAMENKVDALIMSKKEDDAAEMLEKMVEIAPDKQEFKNKLDELSPVDLETITNKLKKNPKDPGLWRKRAELLVAEGNTSDAIEAYLRLGYLVKEPEVYEKVLELNPNNMTAVDKLLELRPDDIGLLEKKVEHLLSEGKSEEATEIYEKLTGLAPDNEDYKSKLAELRPAGAEPAVAEIAIEEPAPEAEVIAPDISVEATPVPMEEPEIELAPAEPEPVIEEPSSSDEPVAEEPAPEVVVEVPMEVAEPAQEEAPVMEEPAPEPVMEEPVAAPEVAEEPAPEPVVEEPVAEPEQMGPWETKIAADPDNAGLYNDAGDHYFENDDYDKALEYFTKSVELVSTDTVALHNKGSVQFVLEKYDDAIATFDQLIAIDGDDIDAYLTKGAAHFKAGRYDDCTASLNEVVKREMNNAAAWYYKSTAEAMKGNLKLVVPFLTRSADIEEEFRERAKTDPSFDQVRDTPEFQVVVNK